MVVAFISCCPGLDTSPDLRCGTQEDKTHISLVSEEATVQQVGTMVLQKTVLFLKHGYHMHLEGTAGTWCSARRNYEVKIPRCYPRQASSAPHGRVF